MTGQFARTALLIGEDALDRLQKSRVAVFGIGGVGGYTVEALARSGVGALDLIDNDTVSITNLNRQIIALHSTVGQYKVDVAAARIHDINPDCVVKTHRAFVLPENIGDFDFSQYDYVVDAIDTVSGTRSTRFRASLPSRCTRRKQACRSSARWGRATSSTRPPLRSAISAKRPFVRLRA